MKRKAFRSVLLVFLLIISLFLISPVSLAHSGGTDEEGGHNSPDGYHYHHGYPAHQHPNGECPYDFDDNVDHRERSSDSSDSISTQSNKSSFLSTLLQLLTIFAIFFISFGLPAIIGSLFCKNTSKIGCFSWIIFLLLLAGYAYCMKENIFWF